MTSMVRALLSLWLLMALLPAAAQGDSLWGVWADSSKPDSSRLKAIQQLSWKTVFERPDSGLALAALQLEHAERIGDLSAVYEAHTTLAVGSSMRSDYATALGHLRRCLAVARELGDRRREANTYSNMSNVYRNLGDLPQALEQLQRSLRIDTDLDNKEGLAGTYNNIGNIHTELNDMEKALENYRKSAALAEELDSPRGRAQAHLNLGSTYQRMGRADTALAELLTALGLYRTMGRKLEMGMAYNNLGLTLGSLGRFTASHAHLDSAHALLSTLGSWRQLARTYINRGTVALQQNRPVMAAGACTEGLRIATDHELLQQEKECRQCLMRAYEELGDFRRAFAEQAAYMVLNDSLAAVNNSREVMRLEVTRVFQERMLADSLYNVRQRFEQELAHQDQLGRERDRRNVMLFSAVGVLAMSVGLWTRLRHVRRSRAAIQRERDRSEGLLLNILPAAVAEELKDKGEAEARLIDQVTVLFTDFKGFTALSEQLSPKDLVRDLNECFSAFDRICEKHGIEKIKTIGDAYMAAGGLPTPNTTHAVDAIHAALDMRDFIAAGKARKMAAGLPYFEIRIGIHTGPVVAGIVGVKKFQYDIWGDTVNTASRMESSGEVGQVNISEATYALVKDARKVDGEWSAANDGSSHSPTSIHHSPAFEFTPRGKVQAKGKGEMEMYFVSRS